MALEPFIVFARLQGLEGPQGMYVMYVPERGWSRNLKNVSNLDYYWTKKFRLAHLTMNPPVLARWLQYSVNRNQCPLDAKVLDLMTLKTWTAKQFITEFQRKPKVYKRMRGPCPRCKAVKSILKNGKHAKHWCYCHTCNQLQVGCTRDSKGCADTCANKGI